MASSHNFERVYESAGWRCSFSATSNVESMIQCVSLIQPCSISYGDHVRYWPKADIPIAPINVCFWVECGARRCPKMAAWLTLQFARNNDNRRRRPVGGAFFSA